MKTYWVSMAPPEGKGRVVLVDAESVMEANSKVHRLGLYRQGDEFYIVEIPSTEVEHTLPRDRLITEDERLSVGACTLGDLEDELKPIAGMLGRFGNP